jgi:tetratricopeptide (TPR) repeat protein
MILGMACSLPIIPLTTNWMDSEMRGHDFGWRYGHDMLVDLDRDAVVYGGTDPGRFVPTYMIFVESFQPERWKRDPNFDRRDLYIITQNALADQTYMNYIRDHYDVNRPKMDQWYHKLLGRDKLYPKEPLKLPGDGEFNQIFTRVVQANQNNPNSGVRFVKEGNGMRAVVEGVEGVFAINGGIAQWIFENNKDKHTFYVEESYPIPWMYPYLEPVGLIMKLNKEPLKALGPDVVNRDMQYWDAYKRKLLGNPAFLRDSVARKSFSKLRSSIGGLYAYRGMLVEAEKALREALEFYPASSEARSRLAEIYTSQSRFKEALEICEVWSQVDPYNPTPLDVFDRVKQWQKSMEKEKEFTSLYEYNKNDPQFIMQYASLLRDRNKWPEADKILDVFLEDPKRDLMTWQQAMKFYADANRADRLETLLGRLVKREPKNATIWLNLAAIQAGAAKTNEACLSLKQALKIDTNLLQVVKTDNHFDPIRNSPEFQSLVH